MGTISKNFSWSEFEDSPTAKAKGILNVINTFEIRDSVQALVLKVLQPLRDLYGKPMNVNRLAVLGSLAFFDVVVCLICMFL